MIRTRAPLRLGLAGGGTDLSPFCDEFGGAVLNCTVGLFAHCSIALQSNALTFVAADLGVKEEHVSGRGLDTSTGLRLHRGVYNRFLNTGLLPSGSGLRVVTSIDAPPGSGLGSSSALVVALCEAFREVTNAPFGLYELAHTAFEIERLDVGLAGGKQDHYAAAFGGVNFIEFEANDRVIVNPLRVHREILLELETSLVICFCGVSRDSDSIIRDQTSHMLQRDNAAMEALLQLKTASHEMKQALLGGRMADVGELLNRAWISKKKTASSITNGLIEKLLRVGQDAGAYAAKVSGAGGGGFLMLLARPEARPNVISRLNKAGGRASGVQLTNEGVHSWRVL